MLHFEDFHGGQSWALGPLAVSKDSIIEFAAEFDPQPFHMDEAAARASILGELSASGWHTLSLTMRLMCDACLANAAVLGASGMEEVKWLAPVVPGDILSGSMTITATRLSKSRPRMGIVNFVSSLKNQRDAAKIEVTGMLFMRTRGAAS